MFRVTDKMIWAAKASSLQWTFNRCSKSFVKLQKAAHRQNSNDMESRDNEQCATNDRNDYDITDPTSVLPVENKSCHVSNSPGSIHETNNDECDGSAKVRKYR